MGSIEVYDYKLQKWVPYVSDPDKWYQHFKDLRDGYVQPDHMGRYIVGSGAKFRKLTEMKETLKQKRVPKVELVTPVAQAIEMAKSEVKREKQRKKETGYKKRKKATESASLPKRVRRVTIDKDSQFY